MPLNAHHLERFVVLMAIHYGFQDKFMLPLNVTKHRNKHFPNAPYLFGRRRSLAAETGSDRPRFIC